MHNVKMKAFFTTILLHNNVHMGNNFKQINSNITYLVHIDSVLCNVKLPKTRAWFRDETTANKTFKTQDYLSELFQTSNYYSNIMS